jgi:hypothetical protein
VAERARFVRIDPERIKSYAAELPLNEIRSAGSVAMPSSADSAETRAAFVLTLNAVNFGSGYFPQLRKRPGLSGYQTIEAWLRERFDSSGTLSSGELEAMNASRCAWLFGQSLRCPAVAELMDLFAIALRDLGALVGERFGGSFRALVTDASGSAERLIRTLLEMPLYRDIARYQELRVPFLKRAQISVADLALALPGRLGRFRDLARLTMFADNLVAHVLRLDGVLRYVSELVERIEREELIEAGSAQEVEIRACEVHAVELLVAELESQITPRELDRWLWMRGGRAAYKARPRHRTRCAFY